MENNTLDRINDKLREVRAANTDMNNLLANSLEAANIRIKELELTLLALQSSLQSPSPNDWKKLTWISDWSSYGMLDGIRFQSEENIEILFPDNVRKVCIVKIDRQSYQGRGGMDESHDQNYPYIELDYDGIPTRLNLYDPKVMESCKARRI